MAFLGQHHRQPRTRAAGAVPRRRSPRRLAPGDAFLLGTDLVKDPDRLVAAYDDAAGVTAEFNRNVLRVVNRELDADFDPDAFDHVARLDADAEWIEMRLRADARADASRVGDLDLDVEFAGRRGAAHRDQRQVPARRRRGRAGRRRARPRRVVDRPRRRLRAVALVRPLSAACGAVITPAGRRRSGTIVSPSGCSSTLQASPSTSIDSWPPMSGTRSSTSLPDPLRHRPARGGARASRTSGSKCSIERRNNSGDAAAHACGEHDVG